MVEIPIEKIDDFTFKIPQSYDPRMRVPGIVYATEEMMEQIRQDMSLQQVANVATLPGIVKASIAMPDIHWGYGFPIGGVAAFDYDTGVISPGGVGYDINCGVSLIRTNLVYDDVKDKIKDLVDRTFTKVPAGLGSKGALSITHSDLNEILSSGLKWAVEKGYGTKKDMENTEEFGSIKMADASKVSENAKQRGYKQVGTLGAGNHFLEIQRISNIYNEEVAKKFGFFSEDQITVMIHTGSRGLGHQVATDYLKTLNSSPKDVVKDIPDRQLISAYLHTKVADDYIGAMYASANFGFANRQIISYHVREAFSEILNSSSDDLGMEVVYSLAHNIAKTEEHIVDGRRRKLMLHRKGATRALPAGRMEINEKYRDIGHPVLIPGDMGSASYVLVGMQENLEKSFGSSCHGAGRLLSRTQAKKRFRLNQVESKLDSKGVYARAVSKRVLLEEAPGSYKDIDEVINAVTGARLTDPVVRMVPIGVMKG